MTSNPIEHTIAERSRLQDDMSRLLSKLKLAQARIDDIITLGCKTEKEALDKASRHLRTAKSSEIIAAVKEVESSKLKTYASVKVPGVDPPLYAGIPDTLNGITVADLQVWTDQCKKTTFSSGNKFQPLPTHDEAWQVYVGIFQESHILKHHANHLRTCSVPRFTDEEVKAAARWGFWHSMTLDLRQRAFKLLPADIKLSIKSQYIGDPEGAQEAVREYYDELQPSGVS